MRVLMFGWEFPPHLSGGLGTACQGLANGLTQNKVDILFVTPFDFSSDQNELSGLHLSSSSQDREFETVVKNPDSPEQNTGQIKQVRVQSYLNPYDQPQESSRQKVTLTQWNYNPQRLISRSNPTTQVANLSQRDQNESTVLEEVYRFRNNVQQFVKDYCFDIIHAHDWMTFDAAINVKQSRGKPLIVHIHSTEFDRAGENASPIVQEIEKRGMEAANLVIAVSNRTRNTIVSRYGIDPNKIEVVYNGVQPMFNGSIRNHSLARKKFITFLGRVTSQKGPEYFVNAAYQVHQKFPDVHFIMGGAGDLLPSMMEKVAALKMSSIFHFTGFLTKEQVDRIWPITNIYVMPSISEPFGITPLEAMGAGIPVILSKQSGVAEIVNQVVKVDFWNTSEIADAIGRLLSQPKLVNRIKRKSRKEVENISWEAASKKIIKAYEKVII